MRCEFIPKWKVFSRFESVVTFNNPGDGNTCRTERRTGGDRKKFHWVVPLSTGARSGGN